MRRADGLLVALVALTLGVGACGESKPEPTQASAPAAAPVQKPAAPATPPPAQAKTETLEILSVLSVEQEVDVLAQRRGVVTQLFSDQGAEVQKGAELARLDDRESLAQLDRARAELQVAQNNVKYNEAEVKAREAAHRRAQEMREAGLNSDADLEEAEFRAQGARFDLESWRSVVKRNQADVHMLELELEKTRIRAPFHGVVVSRSIRLGQDVLADEKCFRLSQLSPLLVRFLVPESSARRPQRGDPVELVLVADSQRSYSARIAKVSPVVDAASGSYDVTAQLTGPDLRALRPGMSVRVEWRAVPAKP